MVEQGVRAMVGEGRSARRGLLRFVLENEGYTVVSEASSTLELAQQLVVHRPDVVVLDDGIDVSAVGMIREVLPGARVILVWPKGVSAVGADARLEPAEVMTGLGPAVARVMGSAPVVPPPRTRQPVPDVIVVPEPEPTPEEREAARMEPATAGAGALNGGGEPVAPVPAVAATATAEEPIVVVPEAISGVLMQPTTEAPTWVHAAPETTGDRGRRVWLGIGLVLLGALIGVLLASAIFAGRTVSIRGVVGSVGTGVLPSPSPSGGGQTGGTSEEPGTYVGVVQVQADGTLRLSSTGDLRLQVNGFVHLVATGVVTVHGDGVVQNATSDRVRLHGNGTVRLVVADGHVRMRLQGSLVGRGQGTVRIGGIGRFLIHHQPL